MNSNLIDLIIDSLMNGQFKQSVEYTLDRRKTKTCKVAVIVSEVITNLAMNDRYDLIGYYTRAISSFDSK